MAAVYWRIASTAIPAPIPTTRLMMHDQSTFRAMGMDRRAAMSAYWARLIERPALALCIADERVRVPSCHDDIERLLPLGNEARCLEGNLHEGLGVRFRERILHGGVGVRVSCADDLSPAEP